MSSGVTDFIVAGPAGHTQAGPAGSFKAGEAGHVEISPAASVPVSPAGHVPIDTSPARIPYAAPTSSPIENRTGGALHTIAEGTGGIVNSTGGYVGGGSGGSSSGVGANTSVGGGGFSTVGSGASGMLGGGSNISNVSGGVAPTQLGAEAHFTPGGNVSIGTSGAGTFLPGGSVPISTALGGANHLVGGRGTATPGGHVPISPGFSHFTPGGMVPMGMGGSHFVPGGMVPISPSLGIDPNVPPARVNPPRPGHVQPSRLTNWHGPSDMHVQNWPRDQFNHSTFTKTWDSSPLKHIWEPHKGIETFLTTDTIDLDALMLSGKTSSFKDLTGARVENKNFDMSMHYDVDRSINPTENNTVELSYETNTEFHFEPHSDGDQNIDMRDQRPVRNDFSEAVNRQVNLDFSSSLSLRNEFSSEHSSVVNFREDHSLTIDDSKSVHNDFSEYMNREAYFDTSVVNTTNITHQGSNVDFEFSQVRSSDQSSSVERGAGGVLTAKS